MGTPTDILVSCLDPRRTRRCLQALAASDLRVWDSTVPIPHEASIRVVIVDRLEGEPPADTAWAARWASGELGVIRLGGEAGGDVCLPEDFTARELGLACRLLAHVVRLRRELHGSRRREQVLRELAYTDPLTGLPNRRAWADELRSRFSRAAAPTACHALALLDLDHFKAVNDRLGHAVGDEVLRQVGLRLATLLPPSGFAARLGGDEFGLLLVGEQPAELRHLVDSLRTAACQGSPDPALTASAGYASTQSPADNSWTTLFHAAAAALRQAKAAGRQQTRPDTISHADSTPSVSPDSQDRTPSSGAPSK